MTSSKDSIHTYINCGRHKLYTTKFNEQTSIDQIHALVRYLCGPHLPNPYCLMVYNDGFNPFRLNSSIEDQDIESIIHFVELYVIDTSDENIENDTQSGIPCNETSSISLAHSSTAMTNERESQQDIPVNNSTTNDNDHHSEDLVNALLSKEQVNIDLSSNDTLSNEIDPDSADLIDALLFEGKPVLNQFVNNDSMEQIAAGDAVPPQTNSSMSIQNLNICQPSIELNESNRPYFSLDVKPEQKDIYKSDQFNQTEKTKINGYVARIQGIKTLEQKMSSVWPKVRIPKFFRNKHNARLAVFVVSEKLENGMRIWFKHRNKGFLPKGFKRGTSSINPIEFDVNESNLTMEGDLRLDLQMTTLWDKLKESEILYKLDEQSTIKLHPAIHDPFSPRLFCIIKFDDQYDVNTICLSDFVRKRPSKRNLTNTTSTGQTNAFVCKRAREK